MTGWARTRPARRALLTGLLLAGLAGSCARSPEPFVPLCPRCNIVLISMDTLRADFVGAYGQERPSTPNIDALAEKGVLFENAISQSSWTRPAHMSMFTGLYPSEHGYIALVDRRRLPAEVTTLAGILSRHGYETAAFTGGVNLDAVFGFDNGFDTFRSNGKYFRDNLEETKLWLDGHHDGPFFLVWHGYDAHTPYVTDPIDRAALDLRHQPPRKSLRKVCSREDKGPGRIHGYLQEYAAAVHRGDRYVGKLLARLAELGLADRTVILFTSDHGEEFLEHGGCFHLNTLYREVLHVPWILVSPGLAPRRVSGLVPASVSVGGTLLDLVGVERREFPGPSLARAAVSGNVTAVPVVSETRRRTEHRRGRGHVRAIQEGTQKLIDWVTLGRKEFFDLREDPGETAPSQTGAGYELLAGELVRWVRSHPLRPFASQATPAAGSGATETDEERRQDMQRLEEQMRSLGYLD